MKKINILIMTILIVGLATAGILANQIIKVEKGNKQILKNVGIGENIIKQIKICPEEDLTECYNQDIVTNLEITDTLMGDNYERCLYQYKAINKCKIFIGNNITAREEWTKEVLNKVASATRNRQNKQEIQSNKFNLTISE